MPDEFHVYAVKRGRDESIVRARTPAEAVAVAGGFVLPDTVTDLTVMERIRARLRSAPVRRGLTPLLDRIYWPVQDTSPVAPDDANLPQWRRYIKQKGR